MCSKGQQQLLDDKFAQFLLTKYPGCLGFQQEDHSNFPWIDAGYYIKTPVCAAIADEDSLNIQGLGIRSLEGIQYFTSLVYLNCSSNKIESSPSLPSSLLHFEMAHNVSEDDPFSYLPQLPNGLKYLDISDGRLGMIMYLNNLPDSLQYLYCSNIGLNSLTLPASLIYLDCSSQYNYSLTSSPPCFRYLPALPKTLTHLICRGNAFSSLPELPESLIYLDCSAMNDRDLDYNTWPTLFCLPKLPKSLKNLIIDPAIKCLPNAGTYTSNYYPPICVPLQGCDMPTYIYGSVFLDLNSNGIKDNNEFNKPNIKLNLSDGTSSFTNNNGQYKFAALSGNYSLTAISPAYYYNAVPQVINFTFNSDSNLVLQPIALQSNTEVDSFLITITSQNAARPGFDLSYLVSYENIGTTSLAPQINLSYDATKLSFNYASNSGVINSADHLILSDSLMAPGEKRNFTANFNVNVFMPLGTNVVSTAAITANTSTSIDSSVIVARGSYDPNDKQATPALTSQQLTNGKFIQYNINFQNTGTDTAFNIIITDTLSNLLQAGTMQILNTSHPCNVTLSSNKIAFEFLNVLLPDSNINEQASHGFVTFRIKPKALISPDTAILNKAFIYFDFNQPVETNTAVTLIKDPVLNIQPYTFIGNGNWSNPANWVNNLIPPLNLPPGYQIIIDPQGECVLDVPQTISAGSNLTIKAERKFKVNGKLTIQ